MTLYDKDARSAIPVPNGEEESSEPTEEMFRFLFQELAQVIGRDLEDVLTSAGFELLRIEEEDTFGPYDVITLPATERSADAIHLDVTIKSRRQKSTFEDQEQMIEFVSVTYGEDDDTISLSISVPDGAVRISPRSSKLSTNPERALDLLMESQNNIEEIENLISNHML